MATKFVQGRTYNHLTWVMVDSTDFATPESALSAALKIKVYGTLETATGINFVSSGTGSLTNDIVHVGASVFGLYHIALAKADLSDASAAWYDEYVVVLSATGAAQQILVVEGVRTDTSYMSNVLSHLSAVASDVYSALTIMQSRVLLNQSRISDTYSMLTTMSDILSNVNSMLLAGTFTMGASNTSDVASAVWAHTIGARVDSRVLLNQSRISDTYSMLTAVSDQISNVNSMLVAGTFVMGASNLSDIGSAVWAQHWTGHSLASSFGSAFEKLFSAASDAQSATTQINSRVLLNQSRISDVYSLLSHHDSDITSLLTTTGIQLNASTMSDLRSAIAGVTATLSVSDISDIASAVRAALVSDLSDILSAATQANSRVLLNQSRISDVYSLLSDAYSDLLSVLNTTGVQLNASTMSDLRSAIAGVTATLSVSDISDIASAVWATPLATKLVQLNTSDLSDLRSAIAAVTATLSVSDISDIASAVRATLVSDLSDILSAAVQTNSRILLVQSRLSDLDSRLVSDISDVLSAVAVGNSRALLNQSRISDTYSMLSDFYSDFQSRVPKAVATNSQLSDLHSDLRSYLAVMSGVQSDVYSGMQLLESAFIGQRGSLASTVTSPSAVEIDGIDHNDQYNGYYIKLHSGSQIGEIRQIVDTVLASSQVIVKPPFNSRALSGVRYTIFAGNPWLSGIHSDLRSYLGVMSGVQSDVYSLLSDFQSDFQSRVPKAVATNSQLSDLHSDLRSYLGVMSDILSNVNSMLIAGTFALGNSNTSDVASAVWAHAIGTRVDSRVLLNQSRISDTYSLLSDAYSDLLSLLTTTGVQLNASTMSDLRSAVAAGPAGALTVSDISDIASAVWATTLATKLVQLNTSDLSDLRSAIAAGPAGALTVSDISDIASAVWATTLATKLVQLNTSDLSDLRSAIAAGPAGALTVSDISDIASAVRAILVSDLSDILSAAVQGNSRALVNQSRISDTYSMLSDFYSDFQSRVPKAVATNSQLSDLHSDLRSFLVVMSGILSDVYSAASDLNSDLRSLITTTGVQLNASSLSDIRSAIAGVTATLSVSDISDIASAVRAILVSDLSDILSAAVQGNSRALVNQSRISDVYSLLSDAYSDLLSVLGTTGVQLNASTMSDLRSAITATTFALGASDISDIASAVRAALVSDLSDILSAAVQGNSRALVNQSRISDVYSLLSDAYSDLLSMLNTTGVQLNASTMSDLRSAITATTFTLSASDLSDIASAVRVTLASDLSDILSAAQQANSRALVVQSHASNIYSLLDGVASTVSNTYSALSAYESDFSSRFPATIPELASDPGATPTWAQANALQYMWLKNNSKSTNSKRYLRNDAGVTVLSGALSDDGASFLQGKLG